MDNRSSDGHRHNRERISPHSSNYQDGGNQSNGSNIKSDSPSRKRRRLQRMSQSPPTIWENSNNTNNNNNSNNNQIPMNQNQNYHYHQNRRLSPRHYHNGQQNSPPIRRQRFRDQQQQQPPPPPRPWDINPTPIFHQASPPHHPNPHPHHPAPQHSLMVEMNHQVPVSLPLSHEQIWTYPTPHISICKDLQDFSARRGFNWLILRFSPFSSSNTTFAAAMSSAQRLLAAIRSGLQSQWTPLHAPTAHTNYATPPTALSTFGATGEEI